MLPSMFATTKRNLIAGVTAVAVLAAGTSPALAWGKGEQQFLAGVATTILLGQLIKNSPKYGQPAAQPQPQYNPPQYYQPRQHRPVRYNPQPVSIYGTPIGLAFNSYSDNEQRRIQSTLTAYGYYHGNIDGSFGPGTYNAITAYARRTGKLAQLNSHAGSYGVLDGLLF
jgi:Putative peptidoglycan binding domain